MGMKAIIIGSSKGIGKSISDQLTNLCDEIILTNSKIIDTSDLESVNKFISNMKKLQLTIGDGEKRRLDNELHPDDDDICNVSDQCSETVLEEIVDDNGCSSDQLSVFNGFIPEEYSIHNIYPNPFNSVTNITYGLPVNIDIQFIVYNISGKHVHTLINKSQTPGYYSVNWNAENYPSGVYFVKMVAGNYINTQKLMLIK